MGGFNLGGFGGQLTADELQRALAAVGGGRMDPAMEAVPQPQASPPVMPQEPPTMERPAPVDAPPEPPPDMSVQRARGGPAKAIETYQGENLEDANRMIELAGQGGGKDNPLDARTYDEQAKIRGRQASQTKANIDTARSQVEERRAHEQRYQQEADRIYEEMRANTQPPPQSTVSKVLGIVGAVAGMGGNKGVASGLGMLSSMLGSDGERWAQEQQANSGLYQAALASVGSDRQGMQSDLDVAQRLTALEAHEIDASLEQVKAMGLSRNATRTAEDLQLAMRQKVREGLIGMEAAKAKAAAARGSSAQEDALWRMPLDALKQLGAGGGLSELGQKVLAQRIQNDQKDRGGEAEIAKKLAGDGTAAQSADERKLVRLLGGVAPAVDNLRKLAADGGEPPHPWKEKLPDMVLSEGTLNQQADMQAVADILLRDESGAAIGEQEAEKKKRGWGITSGDPEVRRRGLQKMLSEYDARLNSVRGGGQRAVAGGGGGGRQSPAPDPRVRSGFSSPTAESVGIRRDASGGIALPRTADPTPQELARAYLSEEGVPEEWLK